VTILCCVAAQDVGKAIQPSYVEGQIQGGVAQGIGWALNEEYIYDKHGRLDNPGFLDYRVPVAPDIPMIDAVLVEVPNPAHPYGAKGVGEVNIMPPMAAIANAIDSAIHRRLSELPMSPPKIRAALDTGRPTTDGKSPHRRAARGILSRIASEGPLAARLLRPSPRPHCGRGGTKPGRAWWVRVWP
jgi:Molybdopterin-binding domain of aldehyde dehydrogenase